MAENGEMAGRIRDYDWSQTSIGSPDNWPSSLRTAIGILLHSKFPMFLFWGDDLICFYNDAFRPSLGNEGKHPWALGKKGQEVWGEIWSIIKPWIDHVLTTREAIWMEDQLVPIYRNGKIEDVYWTFSYSFLSDENGNPGGVFVTCAETTEKVLTLERLKESNSQLHFAIEATELGTWDLNPITNNFRGNARLKEWFGFKPEDEIILSKAIECISVTDRQNVIDAIENALQFELGGHYDIDYTIIHPHTKKERRVRAKGRAWFNENKVAYRFNGTLQDITGQYIADVKIREEEKKFRSTVQQAPVGITILKGADFIVEMANEAYLQIIDKKESEFIGKALFESLPDVRSAVESLLTQVLKTGIPFYGTEFPVSINRFGRKEIAYFNFVYKPLREDSGEITGVIAVANEVTSLVEAKHKLAESEKQFRNLIMQSPIAMAILHGPDMIVEIANAQMSRMVWRREEKDVMGKALLEVFPELTTQKFPELLKQVYETAKAYSEKEAVAYINGADGLRKFYLDFEYSPLAGPDNSVMGILVTANDVTEKVEARQKIEEAEERARMTAESGELGTYEINLLTNEWITTPRLAAIFGVDYPAPRDLLINVIHPDDRELRQEAYEKAYQTGLLEYESRVIHKDGSTHWIRLKGRIYFDDSGKPIRQMGIAQDVTEQKLFEEEMARQVKERTAELESKNKELERSNANLEEFAHAASHDLKEPVRKIHFFTDRLKTQLEDRLNLDELQTFNRIENSTQRMSALIDDLLTYSHVSQKQLEKEEIDLNLKLQKVLDDLELDIQQKQAIIHVGELPVLKGYRRQIQQLFQNLISNGLKYGKPGTPPEINITGSTVVGKDVPLFLNEEELHKKFYCIQVTDKGIGFEQEEAERIFMMFQRLHGRSEYPGTGIGLSIAKKVVENHGGKIIAHGEPGVGATFSIYFPVEE